MLDQIMYFFQYRVFFYSSVLVVGCLALAIMSFIVIKKYIWKFTKNEDELLENSPHAPGISIIAPAYNEETNIVTNVISMLTVNYPLFEVVIVNDGSKDRTLELLIENFDLVEVPFAYIEKIKTKPYKRTFKSSNPEFSKLTVVDKENGGTKADASNAGINASKYPYFVCTDVDCILARNALLKMIQPILNSTVPVIAVGATMRMANACEIDHRGAITHVRPPRRMLPCFQETEYLRSYLISKLGWSYINAVPNISGGLGLFDKSIIINAGGYDPASHAEDMDMLIRIVTYMIDFKKKYKVCYIPITACWTEGPHTLRVFYNQRKRWGRGLMQFFLVHRRFLFNPKYGRVGMLLMPYIFIFEFLAPIIEVSGMLMLTYFIIAQKININTGLLLLGYLYCLGVVLSLFAILMDLSVRQLYSRLSDYLKLFFFSTIEIFIYHPFVTLFSVLGYIDFLFKHNFEWGAMTRQGFNNKNNPKDNNNEVS